MDAKFLVFASLFSLLLAGCTGEGTQASAPNAKLTFANNVSISAEIASDAPSRAKGLMFRESLCENCGMLFIFEKSGIHPFWMKDTLIPLDMIFISENGTIVDIIENVPPCPYSSPSCPNYVPRAPGKFVLEANAGFSKRNGLEIGEKVGISHP